MKGSSGTSRGACRRSAVALAALTSSSIHRMQFDWKAASSPITSAPPANRVHGKNSGPRSHSAARRSLAKSVPACPTILKALAPEDKATSLLAPGGRNVGMPASRSILSAKALIASGLLRGVGRLHQSLLLRGAGGGPARVGPGGAVDSRLDDMKRRRRAPPGRGEAARPNRTPASHSGHQGDAGATP